MLIIWQEKTLIQIVPSDQHHDVKQNFLTNFFLWQANTGPLEWIHNFGLPGITFNATDHFDEIEGLDPNTPYAFRVKATYKSRPFDDAVYVWPPEKKQFVQKTQGLCCCIWFAFYLFALLSN